ncbi:MAG: hypothetical protein JNJ78_17460 [Anaerolineae bacterium]|nr:hypothetical protein [Anaerolineae bacterium]
MPLPQNRLNPSPSQPQPSLTAGTPHASALAGLAARRQPTPAFPQPKATITHVPARHWHKTAPFSPVPAANPGGYSAISAKKETTAFEVASFT